jgi:hypothetical protein
MDATATAAAPWTAGLRGARANLLPGFILQLAACALVLGYYHAAGVHARLTQLVQFRDQTGLGFGVVSTGLFGGVLPYLYLRFDPRGTAGNPHYSWRQGLGLTAFWAYKGIEVELLYRLQAQVVGSGHGAETIALKVFLDQFVYCPVLAVPLTAIVYQWVDAHGRGGAVAAELRTPHWYRRRALPILISNLGVWIPATAIIYALPTPLQLPLQNIVLCFFTLIVAHQTRTGAVRA